ncbi:MAG: N-acetylmannosamine-6-phosphate 2-epimerase [Gallicola sp.]|nr:N-acetylmannosamine-6-phosphate 2-epimerase [Gallicola sp.]
MKKNNIFKDLKHQLIVSCQADEKNPLYCEESSIMKSMAKAAEQAGAKAVCAEGVTDVAHIKEIIDLPVIGLIKKTYSDSAVELTLTLDEVDQLVEAGADMIVIDGTEQKHGEGKKLKAFVKEIREKHGDIPLIANVSNVDEGVTAEKAGVDLVSTDTAHDENSDEVNYDLIKKLRKNIKLPIIAVGKIQTPKQAKKACEYGAFSVIVGDAITNPERIAKRFIDKLEEL